MQNGTTRCGKGLQSETTCCGEGVQTLRTELPRKRSSERHDLLRKRSSERRTCQRSDGHVRQRQGCKRQKDELGPREDEEGGGDVAPQAKRRERFAGVEEDHEN